MTIQQLRNMAFTLGYTLHYDGIYCDSATLCPTYRDAVSRKVFEINMKDICKGLREIESIIADLKVQS